jgi:putative transcriptional regulator
MPSPINKQTLGDLLVKSLNEARDGIRGSAGKLTVKTVEILDPPEFSPAAVHALRDRLALSQALFARLVGVSPKLIEAWERGTRVPSKMACRLLAAISRSPVQFVKHHKRVA